jgi:catechol 2,3-dioxygenase-like lactoylglutathione lyase family enzyme
MNWRRDLVTVLLAITTLAPACGASLNGNLANAPAAAPDPNATRGNAMRPRIKVITLGVSDLNRALAFYRDGMGLPTGGIIGTEFEDGAVVFFNMNDDLILALYPRKALAKDAKVAPASGGAADLSIGHIVGSKREVDALMKQAAKAGATITDAAHDRFWGGYSGYFQDPDGHLWEIAWNPQWPVPEEAPATGSGKRSPSAP